MSKRKVWWNGKLIPESEAKVSIYDSALMFGDTNFTMLRTFNKKVFKLEDHIRRLYNGIKILQIPIKMTESDMYKACMDTMKANKFEKDDEHRLMINVTRGLLGIYSEIGDTSPNVIIADFPLRWTVQGMGVLFDKGINAVIPQQRAIPSSLLEPKIKNRSRIHYLMANMEVANYKGKNNWALLLDPDGFIAEGTGDNFFIVKDGTVITPEGRNILRGISRQYIFELCKDSNIECIEKNIESYDVYTADEAFMTGTPFCMLPVTSLNGIKIDNGKPGHVYNELLDYWGRRVNIDIKKQIKSWDKGVVKGNSPYQFKKET
jgi:branched-chain amino acid aminotransferase